MTFAAAGAPTQTVVPLGCLSDKGAWPQGEHLPAFCCLLLFAAVLLHSAACVSVLISGPVFTDFHYGRGFSSSPVIYSQFLFVRLCQVGTAEALALWIKKLAYSQPLSCESDAVAILV